MNIMYSLISFKEFMTPFKVEKEGTRKYKTGCD